jgi:hypothetical protein
MPEINTSEKTVLRLVIFLEVKNSCSKTNIGRNQIIGIATSGLIGGRYENVRIQDSVLSGIGDV